MLKKLFSKKDIAVAVKRLARLIEKDFPGEEISLCLSSEGFFYVYI